MREAAHFSYKRMVRNIVGGMGETTYRNLRFFRAGHTNLWRRSWWRFGKSTVSAVLRNLASNKGSAASYTIIRWHSMGTRELSFWPG